MASIFRKLFPKSLSQEVIEAFDSAPEIKKLGHNDEDDYDFLEIQAMCREFKGGLFRRGIIISATDADCTFEQISEGKNTFTIRCTVRTKFEARRECWFGMQRFDMGEALGAGLDTFDHIALAIAQTFAYKAMLKRSSMTYGEKDDPEVRRASPEPRKPKEPARPCYECGETVSLKQAHDSKKATGRRLCVPCLARANRAKEAEIMQPISDPEFIKKSVDAVRRKAQGPQEVAGILDKQIPRNEEMEA